MLVQLALRLLPLLALGAQDGYVKSFESAWKAVESGDLSTARARYTACLDVRPHSAACEYHLACLSAREGKSEEALAWLKRSIDDGYDDAKVAIWEPDLAPIRERTDFALLLARIESNSTSHAASATWYSHASLRWQFDPDAPQFSPDGERVVAGSGGAETLWDVASGRVIAVLPGSHRGNWNASFSPDGRVIAASQIEGGIRIWDARSGVFLRELENVAAGFGRVSFSHDGSRILCAQDCAWVWDVASGKRIGAAIAASQFGVLSPDGERVLAAHGLYAVNDGHAIASFHGIGGPMHSGAFSIDGKLAFVLSSADATVHVFDGVTGTEVRSFGSAAHPIDCACFAGTTQRLATHDRDGRLQLWQISTGESLRTMQSRKGWSSAPFVSRDGRSLLLPDFHSPELWNLETGQLVWSGAERGGDWSFGGDFSPNCEFLLLPTRSHLELRRASDGALQRALHSGLEVSAPTPAPRSSLPTSAPASDPNAAHALIGLGDGRVLELDVTNGATTSSWKPSNTAIEHCVYSGDGRRCLASDKSGRVFVWNARGAADIQHVGEFAHGWYSPQASFSPDGARVLVLDQQKSICVWNCETHAIVWRSDLPKEQFVTAAWSIDSSLIGLNDAGMSVQFRDAGTGESRGTALAHSDHVNDLAFSPDGTRLATGCDDGFARIWKLADGSIEHTLHHPDMFDEAIDVRLVRYSADGTKLLTTTGDNHIVTLWSAADGKKLWSYDFSGGNPCALGASISRDGKRVCTSGSYCATSSIFDEQGHRIEFGSSCPWGMDFTSDGSAVVAIIDGAFAVLDPISGSIRFTRAQFDDDAQLIHVLSLQCNGTSDALRATHVVFDQTSAPLDCFAEQLFDPRKVAASLAGVAVATPRLAQPPVIELMPRDRVRKLAGEAISIAASATDPLGLAGFEVERDGGFVDPKLVQAATKIGDDGTRAELALSLPHSADAREIEFEVRALSKSGVLSRPARVTFRAKP
jgi:WD40 repeat protein